MQHTVLRKKVNFASAEYLRTFTVKGLDKFPPMDSDNTSSSPSSTSPGMLVAWLFVMLLLVAYYCFIKRNRVLLA